MKPVYSKTIEKSIGFAFALWSAGAKAYEYLLPPSQRVLEDPLASYYAGKSGLKMVQMLQSFNPVLRKAIVLRARYMDDCAQESIKQGYKQVVLMGAGYDSRYWRIPEFRQTDLFELDLESTQKVKKSMTKKLTGELPKNIRYIALDFSKDSMMKKLISNGFDVNKKTLFIWEGVSLFLNLDIVLEILGWISELCYSCRLVFDFVPEELICGETNYGGNYKLIKLCASIKEPLTFGCSPEIMRKHLISLGYHNIKIINMQQASLLYSKTYSIEDCYYFLTADSDSKLKPDKADNSTSLIALNI